MKKIILISFMFFCFCITSCLNDIDGSEVNKGGAVRKGKESRGAFDTSLFTDVTMKNINANDITVKDFNRLCNGQYKGKNGVLTINRRDNTVNINCSNVKVGNEEYSNVFLSYEYQIKAAGNNVLYMCPKNVHDVKVSCNGETVNADQIGSFATYISLYGFGQGRLEVSPHLDGVSLTKSGTYWSVNR